MNKYSVMTSLMLIILLLVILRKNQSTVPIMQMPSQESPVEAGVGTGTASVEFNFNKMFFRVGQILSKQEVDIKITESAGVKVIEYIPIADYKKDDIRYSIHEKILSIDTTSGWRKIRVRSESQADISGGWIRNKTWKITSDDVIQKYISETEITGSWLTEVQVKITTTVAIKKMTDSDLSHMIESGLNRCKNEMLRQMQ